MTISKFSNYLHTGEEVLQYYQRQAASYFFSWVLALVFIIPAFFFLWPLFQAGTWGVVAFAVILAIGLVILLRTFLLWRGNIVLVTNERILDLSKEGMFGKSVSQATYNEIQDVSWQRNGLWATLWRYGDVQLVAGGGSIRLIFPCLKNPQQVVDFIISLRNKARKQ